MTEYVVEAKLTLMMSLTLDTFLRYSQLVSYILCWPNRIKVVQCDLKRPSMQGPVNWLSWLINETLI
jgi:hypothetical protein